MSAAVNPFRALRGYTSSSEDQKQFFGRDRDLTLMLDRVLSRRTTLLFAGSGVGKSSFLQARVIPEMSDRYFVAHHSRWGQPLLLQSLIQSIRDGWSASAKQQAPEFSPRVISEECLVELYSGLPLASGQGRLLILDQFEELFQHHGDTPEFDHFILSLAALIRCDDPEVRVVFSMREEFLGELSVFDNLIPDLFNNYYRLKPLTRRQARQIIEGTSKSVEIQVGKTVGALIDDLVRAGDKGREKEGPRLRDTVAPPFLQIACHGLWNRRPPQKEFPTEYVVGDAARELHEYVRRILDGVLGTREKKVLTDALAYLITRKGAKIACDANVLAHQIHEKEDVVTGVLGRLSTDEAKVFRRTEAADGSTWFELYHDMYAPFLSDWRADQLRVQAANRKRAIWSGAAVAVMLLAVLGGLTLWQASKAGAAQATLQAKLNAPKDVYALRTGQHADRVLDVAFSPDGKQLATASGDGTAKLWDAATGLSTYTFTAGKLLNAVDFARGANGLSLITGGADGKVTLIETGTESLRSFDFGRTVYTIATNANRTQVACAGQANIVKIWNASGGLTARIETKSSAINALAYTPDGQSLIAGDVSGRVSRLDVSGSRGEVEISRHPVAVLAVAVSPDGRWIASGSRDTTTRLSSVDGSVSVELKGHTSSVRSVAFSPDSKLLVTGGLDGEARVWNVADRSLKTRLVGHTGAVYGVAFDPSGKTVASSGQDRTTRIWDVENANPIAVLEGSWEVPKVAGFLSDLKAVFMSTLDNYASYWQIGTESKEEASFSEGAGIAAIATASGGVDYAYATPSGKIRICQTINKSGCFEIAGKNGIRLLAISQDGRSVASVAEGLDGVQVNTISIPTIPGDDLAEQAPPVRTVSFGRRRVQFLALGYTGASIGMADERSYVFAPETTPKAAPDGKRIIGISYTSDNGGVVFFDDSTALITGVGEERRIESNGRPRVRAVTGAIADDGRSIAFAYEDGSVHAWDQSGTTYQPVVSGRRVLAIGFSKRGTQLGVLDSLGTVRIFSVEGSGSTGGGW